MNPDAVTLIDIEKIVKQRAGVRAKYIPNSFFSWLRRFIHEDFINKYLEQGRMGVDFCQGTLDYLGVKVTVKGKANLPTDARRYTFVSNHPLGAIDGVTLGSVLGQFYDGRVKYLVNDLLMNLRGLAPLCVPINKIGAQSRSLPEMVDGAFRSDNHVIMFPAGLCSRKQGGVVRDLKWGKSFIVKSVQHKRDVVPIHFLGENSKRFYRVANLCKRLRLPNFAMALLPDEMYRSRGNCYEVRIGKPIPWQTFTKERPATEWAEFVKEEVYKI
ncbi:MAG: 1-acyl-sn-glycerol-3-phosphate acyltransferase [Prevotellaceae bacterium]|nr:1-acyl-sn-glycerol-3-phosphate acyltransferase [Prevotellaceae bacterium]